MRRAVRGGDSGAGPQRVEKGSQPTQCHALGLARGSAPSNPQLRGSFPLAPITPVAAFRGSSRPQRRGLRPLRDKRWGGCSHAPPGRATGVCLVAGWSVYTALTPRGGNHRSFHGHRVRLFLAQTAPHDGQPGCHGRRESTTGRQAAWTSPAPDHSTLRPPCRRPSGQGGGESGRLSQQPCDLVSMLQRSIPASVHAQASQLMAAAVPRAGMPSHCSETDLREKEISYSTSRMFSTDEVARMRSLEISLATMTPLTGASSARFSLTQPMYRRS